MEDQVSWVIELAVKPGELEAFKTLMEEMVAGTSLEPTSLAALVPRSRHGRDAVHRVREPQRGCERDVGRPRSGVPRPVGWLLEVNRPL